jgi:hypothetical protein
MKKFIVWARETVYFNAYVEAESRDAVYDMEANGELNFEEVDRENFEVDNIEERGELIPPRRVKFLHPSFINAKTHEDKRI